MPAPVFILPHDVVALTVTGTLANGGSFLGCDSFRVMNKRE
jgi:hypothetical protein